MAGMSNSAMARALGGDTALPPVLRLHLAPMVSVQREEVDGDAAQHAADAVYDALDGWNDEDKAIAALANTGQGTLDAIAQRFADSHGTSLDAYLKD